MACICSGVIPNRLVQCKACIDGNASDPTWVANNKIIDQKRAWKQVRVDTSQYLHSKAAATSGYDRSHFCGNLATNCQSGNALVWNQASDRVQKSNSTLVVPSHGNSTKRSLTRHRPGCGAPGGKGVDIKHNSYDRYLARKKAKNILTQNCTYGSTCPEPIYGNKYKAIGILSSQCTRC